MRKTRSKLLSVLMAFVMVMSMVLVNGAITVQADGADLRINITPNVVNARQGDEIYVDVELSVLQGTGWAGAYFFVEFDTSRLALIPYLQVGNSTRWWGHTNPTDLVWLMNYVSVVSVALPGTGSLSPGEIAVQFGFNPDEGDVTLPTSIRFRFEVLDNATDGEAWVRWGMNPLSGSFNENHNELTKIHSPADDANIWIGSVDTIVTVIGPHPDDVVLSHPDFTGTWVRNLNDEFVANTLTPLTGDITASAVGFITGSEPVTTYVDGEARVTITLVPVGPPDPGYGWLVGRVTNSANGDGIGGALVTVSTATGTVTALTNTAGYYVVNNLAPGEVTVLASADGFIANFSPANPVTIVADAPAATANVALDPVTFPGDGYTLIVTVDGPAGADITLTHGTTVFNRSGNVFVVTTENQLSGNVTASAPFFTTETAAILPYVDGVSRLYMTLIEEITIPGYGMVEGYVTNVDNGNGIGGATVTVVTATGTRVVTTNAAGFYRVINIAPGPVTVHASADGFIANFSPANPVTIIADATATANVALAPVTFPGDGYTLIVTVRGPGLVAGAANIAHDTTVFTRSENVFTVTTENQLAGNVTASALGFENTTRPIPVYVDGIARLYIDMDALIIPPGRGAIQGTVTCYDTGDFIEDAIVVALNYEGDEVGRAVTDEFGAYVINALYPIVHRLIVVRAGYDTQSRDVTVIVDQIITEDFELVPNNDGDEYYTLVVNVISTQGTAATVRLNGTALTAENGVWTVTGNAAVTGTVRAVALGYFPEQAEVVAGDFVNRVFVLTLTLDDEDTPSPEGVLRGFVRELPGRTIGIPGAIVTAIPTHTDNPSARVEVVTDADGFFIFENLDPGTYNVVARASQFETGVAASPVTITETEGASTNVYLNRGALQGFVLIVNVDPAAAVAAGPTITYGGWTLTRLGDSNSWSIHMPMVMNNLSLEATAPGFDDYERAIPLALFTQNNNIGVLNIRMQQETGEGVLQGYVIDEATGTRLPNAMVKVVHLETGDYEYMLTNSEGFYRFENLELGDYTVIAWADGFDIATSPNSPVTLVAGTEGGVHENVYLTAADVNWPGEYRLNVVVVGPETSAITITMPGTVLVPGDTANVWNAQGTAPMVGDITVVAQFFQTAVVPVIATDYVDGVARIVIIMEEPDAVIRFHRQDANGNLLEPVDIQVELGQAINIALIPVAPTRYAAHLVPGQHFMGWFTADQLAARPGFATPHDVAQPRENRAVAFDLTQVITDQMLDDLFDENGILHLYESWLQYGDVRGLGVVDGRAITHLRQFMNHQVDAEDVIMVVGDVRKLGTPGAPIVDGRAITQLSQFMNHQHVFLGVEPTS